MGDSLKAAFGLYGGALVIAFVAGMFPLVSAEAFLLVCTLAGVATTTLTVMIPLAVVGHQIAKTITYYAGAGAFELPQGRVRTQIAKAQRHIDRWNKRPRLVMFVAAATGLPPLYLLGFIAKPLMHMSFATFTVITVVGRALRFVVIVFVIAPVFH